MVIRAASLAPAMLVLSAACTPSSADRGDAFAASLQSAGFECAALASYDSLDASESAWRILCTDGLAYLASHAADGRICLSPMMYGDPGLPGGIRTLRVVPAPGTGAAGTGSEVVIAPPTAGPLDVEPHCVPYGAG